MGGSVLELRFKKQRIQQQPYSLGVVVVVVVVEVVVVVQWQLKKNANFKPPPINSGRRKY